MCRVNLCLILCLSLLIWEEFARRGILTCVFVWQVGGLADVVTGLGRSLLKKGHRVEIIIPKYKCMDVSCVRNFKVCNNFSLFGAKCGKLH